MVAAAKVTKQKASSHSSESLITTPMPVSDDKIAELAYYKAESRGFAPGHELEDWLEAEKELTLQ